MRLHISTTVAKLGTTIPTVNQPPIKTCMPNPPCKDECYARMRRFGFPTTISSLERNLECYLEDAQLYFDTIDITLRQIPYRYFRYHSSGDIVDENYLEGMYKIAEKHPNTQFLCFTKKDYLVNEYIKDNYMPPKNLVIVLSAWGYLLSPKIRIIYQ